MDVVEYLLNFIERIEEGLGEDKPNKSGFPKLQDSSLKGNDRLSELDHSALTNDSESDFESVNQSYFDNTQVVEEEPLKRKELNEYTNSVAENFFGEQTMVTKL